MLGEILPWCAANDVAFIPFSPLGRGFLTGSFQSPDDLAETDWRRNNPRFAAEAMAANQALVDLVRSIAERHEATAGQVALAWVLAQGDDVIPIPGTTKIPHLESNAAATDVTLTEDDLQALDGAAAQVRAPRADPSIRWTNLDTPPLPGG